MTPIKDGGTSCAVLCNLGEKNPLQQAAISCGTYEHPVSVIICGCGQGGMQPHSRCSDIARSEIYVAKEVPRIGSVTHGLGRSLLCSNIWMFAFPSAYLPFVPT